MYHPQTGYSESMLSSLGLGGSQNQVQSYQPQDPFAASSSNPSATFSSSTSINQPFITSPSRNYASALHEPVFVVSPTKNTPNKSKQFHQEEEKEQTSPSKNGSSSTTQPSASSLLSSTNGSAFDPSRTLNPPAVSVTDAPTPNLTACAFVLFILGPPGSGKTTMCQRLVSEFGFIHLDLNVLLNGEIKIGSNTGRLISDFLKLGKQVPGEIVAELLKHHISVGLATSSTAPSSSSSSSSSSGSPLSTFFCVEHFPSDPIAWKTWQKFMASGMMRVMRHELGGNGNNGAKSGGGLATAIELKAPLKTCVERLARRASAGDDQTTVERRMRHYETTITPLIQDISRFSLAVLGKVSSGNVAIETVWNEVKNVTAALIVRISLTPPLPSNLIPQSLSSHPVGPPARRRIFPVFVLGGPGSGRSLLCRRLSEEYKFIHLNFEEIVLRASVQQEPGSLGAIGQVQPDGSSSPPSTIHSIVAGSLSNNAQTPQQILAALMNLTTTGNETARAIHISNILKDGRQVSPELAMELVLEPLRYHLAAGHTMFLFDGFPTLPDQWRLILLALWGIDAETQPQLAASLVNQVTGLYLECPERIRHSRLLRRRLAKDSPRTIEARMRAYEAQTLPMEVVLMNQNPKTIFRISAGLSEGEVFREVTKRVVMSIITHIELADPAMKAASTTNQGAAEKMTLMRELRNKAEKGDVVYKLGGTNANLGLVPTPSSSSSEEVVQLDPRRSLARLIFLFGPPGSGKQQLATQLTMDYEIVHLDMDTLVNKAIANRSQHRAAILQHMQMQQAANGQEKYGELAILPSYIALDLISSALATNLKAGSSFFLITGFPASKAQFESFQLHLLPNVQMVKCFYLDTSSGTTSTTNTDASPIQDDQQMCMERLTSRGDHFDDINLRFKIYNQNTKPLLESLCAKPAPSTTSNSVSPKKPKTEPGVIGSMAGAPIYVLHAGSKVTKQSMYDQLVLYFSDLNYLILPPAAKKQVSKSVVFVLFIMGGLGAGKRTITQRILHDYDFIHLEIDHLLNEEIEQGTNEGMILQQIFLHGGALPSETVATIIKRHITRHITQSKKTHFLISGFPIDELGWQAWIEVMGSAAEIPTAIYLDCPEEIRRERLLARGENETNIRQAFTFFTERTVPLIDALTAKGTVITLSSMESIETVYGRVQNELEILLHSLRAPVHHNNLGQTGSRVPLLSTTQPLVDGMLGRINPLAQSQQLLGRARLPDVRGQDSQLVDDHEPKVYVLGKRPTSTTSSGGQFGLDFPYDASSNGGAGGSFPSNYAALRYNLMFVFASPGAGVTTQLRRLRSTLIDPATSGNNGFSNLHYVDMEELVRTAMENGTPLGRTIGVHLKAAIQGLRDEKLRSSGLAHLTSTNRNGDQSTALVSKLFHEDAQTLAESNLKPLTLISSSLLAQLLKQHLEQLLVAQDDAEYKLKLSQPAETSLASKTTAHILSKINCIIGGFPNDERGWEEFLQVMSTSGAVMDLRHQLYFDAPEGVRMDRLRKSGQLSLTEIHARMNEFNTRLLPLIQKISLTGQSGSDLQPSLYHVSTTPSVEIVHLQLMNALQTKFGLYLPMAALATPNQQDGVWKHPYGLRRRNDPTAPSSNLAAQSTALTVAKSPIASNQSRPIFVLFLFGPPGSGRSTLCEALTDVSSSIGLGRDFETRSWGFIELDLLVLAEDEVNLRAGSSLAYKIKQHWAERNAVMLKDPATLDRSPNSADAKALVLPKEISVALILQALHFHTKNLFNFAFVIRNFPQDLETWQEWEHITMNRSPSANSIGSKKYGSDYDSYDSKLKPLGLWLDAPPGVRNTRLKLGVGFSPNQVAQAEYIWNTSTKPLVESLVADSKGESHIVKLDGSVSEMEVVAQAKDAIRTLMASVDRPNRPPAVDVEQIQQMVSGKDANKQVVPRSILTSSSAPSTSLTDGAIQNKVILVIGSPGSGRKTFCQHLSQQPFSLNPRNPHEVQVKFVHIDVEELYRTYSASHPSVRLENELSGGQAPARPVQARNLKLTIYLIRQAILAATPKQTATTANLLASLPNTGSGDANDDDEEDEDEALEDMDLEDPTRASAQAAELASSSSSNESTLFLLSGFPRDAPEWAAWQEEIEGSKLAKVILIMHLDVDLMTSTKRLMARGDKQDAVKSDLNLYTYKTVPLIESFIHESTAAANNFQMVTIHAASPLQDVLDETVIQLRKRNVFAAAVEMEQVRLSSLGNRRMQLAMKKKQQRALAASSFDHMVGSQGTIYQLGEKQSYLLEIQSLLSQLPSTPSQSPLALLVFMLGLPGSGLTSHSARASRGHHHLATIHLDSLLDAEIASGSRRGVLIANARAEKKGVSKWLRIILFLQQLLALTRTHVAASRSAAEVNAAESNQGGFIPSDVGAVSVAAQNAIIEPLAVLVVGFPATQGEWNGWKKVLGLGNNSSNAALAKTAPAPSALPITSIKNLAFLLPDVDADTCIARLLRSGYSTLNIDSRLSSYKARTAPFIQAEFGSTPGRVVRIQSNSTLPAWNEPFERLRDAFGEQAVIPNQPLAFSFDARPREQAVYETVCTFVRQYLVRTILAAPSHPDDRFGEHAAGAVYTVGKPIDSRPKMSFFFLLGAPGSGVRTYLQRIRARYDFEVVDLASIISAELRKKGAAITADTRLVAQCISQRVLLPPELACRLLMQVILAQNTLGKSQFLVTNFPQTKLQWDLFTTLPDLTPERATIKKILFLDTPEKERVARMEKQLGAGSMDEDGQPKITVNPVDIEQRISNYNTQTKKIMSELLAKNLLSRVSTKGLVESGSEAPYSVDQQIGIVFEKICAEHIDPTWNFLRHHSEVQQKILETNLSDAAGVPGERRVSSIGSVTMLPLGSSPSTDSTSNIKTIGEGEEKTYEVVPGGSFVNKLHVETSTPRFQPQPPSTKNPFSQSGALSPSPSTKSLARDRSRDYLGGISSPTAPGKLKEAHTLFVMFLVGGPGSGKRTMAARLEQAHPNYVDIDLNTLEADEIARQTEAGKAIVAARQYGRIPPSNISLLLLNRALKHAAVLQKRLAIIHGFPEDIDSWKSWQNSYGNELPALIYLVCPENIREARLLNDNVPLYQIKIQQSLFQNYTVPLLDLLGQYSAGSITKISALANRDKVFDAVNAAAQHYLAGLEQEIHQDPAQWKADQLAKAQRRAEEEAARAAAELAAQQAAAAASPYLKVFPTLEAKAARSQLEGEYLHLSLSATDLEKPDFFTTANPYFEFYRFVPTGSSGKQMIEEEKTSSASLSDGLSSTLPSAGRWEKIYQSPVAFNTLTPTWNSFLLDNDYLTSRQLSAPILCVLWSWSKGDQAKFMCSIQTTVRELMDAAANGTKLILNRTIQLGQNGNALESKGSNFVTNKNVPAGALSISLCKRLIYRPLEEVIAQAPRPPSAARSDPQLSAPNMANNNVIAVPVLGSLAAKSIGAGVNLPPTFSSIPTSALLGSDRVYEPSECVVRLSLIGEYLESKGWTSSTKSTFGSSSSRDGRSVIPQAGMLASTLNQLTAGSATAGGANRSKCDPYVDIYGLDRDPATRKPFWKLVYSTEILENTRSPKWNIFCLRLWSLCANDYYRPILFKVWDHSIFGSPEFIGEVQTNLKEILIKSMGQARFELVHPTNKKLNERGAMGQSSLSTLASTGSYEHAGSLVFTYARVFSDIKYSQLERGGNGFPKDIKALMNQKPNNQS